MPVRKAALADVPRIVALCQRKRQQYEPYSPVLWHESSEAFNYQTRFFEGLLTNPSWICLVHESYQWVDAFLLAHIIAPPPVYDPGGKVCLIDDFAVEDPELWQTAGMALRNEAQRLAIKAGAAISITVCGQKDTAKRVFLAVA